MDIKSFLNTVCQEIKYEPVRKEIAEELELHIQDIKEDYINDGMENSQAEEKAVSQMGEAEEIGKKLDKIHRPKLDWKLLVLTGILIGYGLLVSVLQYSINNNRIMNTIFCIILGIAIGVCIYFFNYTKLRRYSGLIYLTATILMIFPIANFGHKIAGVSYIRIFGITIDPCMIAVPLYMIAFIGYIANYNRENVIKIQMQKKEIVFSIDLIKIVLFSILSLILIINRPSLVNAAILGTVYLVIATVKIVKNKEKRVKRLLMLYGIMILFFTVFFIMIMMKSPFRFSRITASFWPERDPSGSGYTGMLQKEILENAKLVGQADTKIITDNQYIVSNDTTFTFIYLIRKNWNIHIRNISDDNPININETYF